MTPRKNNEMFYAELVEAYQRPTTGWDFSSLRETRLIIRSEAKWNYQESVRAEMQGCESLLDMDTGGGEILSSFQPLPLHTYATESYEPNIQLARQRLSPLGVTVCEVHTVQQLPFVDNQFDLIINRHGAYDPSEVLRVLKPGQRFITMQVDSKTNQRLHTLLGREKQVSPWNLAIAASALKMAGWQVLCQEEESSVTRYLNVPSIVYYLKMVPWEVPDFSVERYYEQLLEIEQQIQNNGYIEVSFHQFFLIAQKPL